MTNQIFQNRKVKKSLVIFALLIISVSFLRTENAYAQLWAPPNAKWYYSYSNFWITGYVSIEKISDTLILDNASGQFRNCQKLFKTFYSHNHINGSQDTISLGSEYTWNNDDTVFIFKHNQFYVLYDFSAQPGDTWVVPETYNMFDICDSVGVVKVVFAGDTVINSEPLRYLIVEPEDPSHWALYGTIIEKIGPLYYMLPEQNCVTDIMEGGPLRCYEDNTFQYTSEIAPYCDYLVGMDEPESNPLAIYPNPAEDHLKIKCLPHETFNVEIVNISGQTVGRFYDVENGAPMNLTGLKPGLYMLSLRNENTIVLTTKLQIIKK